MLADLGSRLSEEVAAGFTGWCPWQEHLELLLLESELLLEGKLLLLLLEG